MAAAEHAAGSGPTAGEYIIHHLTHLQNQKQTAIVDFSVFNLDSIFFKVLLAVIFLFVFLRASRRATAGVPGKLQCALEMVVTGIDGLVRETFHGQSKFIAPLANLETKLADIRVAAMPPAMPPSSDVVVIAIDEATLAGFPYRSPVDRGLVADLIEQLEGKGAAAK